MIGEKYVKINYTSTICTDVLRDLENCMKTDDIDTWLEKQVQTIDFNAITFHMMKIVVMSIILNARMCISQRVKFFMY